MAAPQSDEVYDWADAIELMMESDPRKDGWTPSAAARKTGLDTAQADEALRWMAREGYVHTSGNGCWTHYFPRHQG